TSNPDLYIAYEVPESIVGDPVEKVGRTTGMTRGEVTRTCVDVHIWGNDHALPCQDFADYGSADGDSGSPVYSRYGADEVTMYGIHHAESFWGDGIFSPMWLVRIDYPHLMVIPW